MNRNGFGKSYDVKTFLNKKKPSSRFVFLTFANTKTGVLAGIIAFIIIGVVFCNTFCSMDFFVNLSRCGIENSVFLWNEGIAIRNCNLEKLLINTVSPFYDFTEAFVPKKKREIPKAEPEGASIKNETVYTNGVEIKNETNYPVETASLLAEEILSLPENPKVLIVHTHGSESYTPSNLYPYKHSGNYRTQNTDFNVIKVGEELKKALESKGIAVIHDRTINDYPSYNDSYNKAGRIIKEYIDKDKDIAFVFDVHRDAVGTSDSIVKFTAEIEGKNTAQVMIVCGSDVNLENPLWRENLKLAVHIQDFFLKNYPGFLRPVNLRKERFNMHLTTGSLLFEIGTNGNSLEEALSAAEILGKGLGDFVNILKNP